MLNGEVEWCFQKEAAGQPVRTLIGVAGISNLIEIKPTANADYISQQPPGAGFCRAC
jgi:osmotically-inducible protein OsmY